MRDYLLIVGTVIFVTVALGVGYFTALTFVVAGCKL